MNQLLSEQILVNYGGIEQNNLMHIIQEHITEIDNISNLQSSIYVSNNDLQAKLNVFNDNFTVLSLNCQSLPAKFDKIHLLVEELKLKGFEFSALCFQETWLNENSDTSLYQLDNYNMISQGYKCTKHGGLAIYLHKKYTYCLKSLYSTSQVWEALFIEISNLSKKIIIGNIYRPPKDSNINIHIQQFMNEFEPILRQLSNNNSHKVLLGDFNLDLLKLNDKPICCDYFDMMMSHSFKPTVTLPTRLNEHTNSASLIDNIYLKLPLQIPYFAATLVTNISDHFPCLLGFKNTIISPKHHEPIFYRNCTEHSMNLIYEELSGIDFSKVLDTSSSADINKNYEILINIIMKSMNKHMPLVKHKNHKHKDKRSLWITAGIIRSIKFRDNLYKSLKIMPHNSPDFQVKKHNLKIYNKILKNL